MADMGLQSWLCIGLFSAGLAQAAPTPDLMSLDLEEIMGVKVYAASKYSQATEDAPSAVTVITAEEIRTFGWRTLGDMLKAQRGMYLSYDRIYGYLGVRGILVSGDLNSRILIMVDGHRTNDVIYDQAFILNDFMLDTDLIERVEVIRGPGSSMHGTTPLFAVINIVTRDPARSPKHELSAEAGSDRWLAGRYTYTHLFEDNASLMLSASGLRTDGPDLYFPEFDDPDNNFGRTSGTDDEEAQRLFAKYESPNWRLLLMHSRRDKGIPTGATGAVFDNPGNHYVDTQTALNLGYTRALSGQWQFDGRLYYGAYDFHGNLLYDPGPVTNKDLAWGRWWGTELMGTYRGDAHTLVTGIEYQANIRQDQRNYDVEPYAGYLDDRRDSSRLGLYLQDEWRLTPRSALTLGLRYDHDGNTGSDQFSPRLAWVSHPAPGQTWKLIYSSAYRAPNVAEMYYVFGQRFIANPDLDNERITTLEAVFEHRLSARTRYTVNPYLFRLSDRITQVATDPMALPGETKLQYQNLGTAEAAGIELELEHQFAGLGSLRTSYAYQDARDSTDDRLENSPHHVFTLNYARPILGERLGLGLEYQYVSQRLTFKGLETEATHLVNLNLSGRLGKRGLEWAFGIYNLLDHEYSTPDTPDPAYERDRIYQDGRSWRLKLTYPI